MLLVIVVMFAEETFKVVIVVPVICNIFARAIFTVVIFALVIFANEAFKTAKVPVPTVPVVIVNVPMLAVVRFAEDAFNVAKNEFETFTLDAFKITTFAFAVVISVETIALC